MFYKIVQKSSHISLSVNCVLFIPCISLGGAPCTKLENKTLLCLIVKKTLSVCHQTPKRGRLKVHLVPLVSFGGLMTNN
jgi:hypothetical protein